MKIEDIVVELGMALKHQTIVNTKILDYAIEVTGLLPANEQREPAVKSLRAMLEAVSEQREAVATVLVATKKALNDEQ